MLSRSILGCVLASVLSAEPRTPDGNAGPPRPASDAAADVQPPMRETLERELSERLSGAVLTGCFTVDGQPADRPLQPERYTIHRASKLKGDLWLIQARMEYGGRDLTLPLPLPIHRAGDTPVITLTDLTLPGLGTFTARVLIYEDYYAGTWKHGEHGGHLFGTISHPQTQPAGAPATRPATQPAPAR